MRRTLDYGIMPDRSSKRPRDVNELAALIVGAALLMRVETSFTIFGYPGIAIIFFFIAAGAGMFLVFNILFKDEKSEKKQ